MKIIIECDYYEDQAWKDVLKYLDYKSLIIEYNQIINRYTSKPEEIPSNIKNPYDLLIHLQQKWLNLKIENNILL